MNQSAVVEALTGVRKRLIQNYMRGFRRALHKGEPEPEAFAGSSYMRGFEAGAAALVIGEHQAERYADAFSWRETHMNTHDLMFFARCAFEPYTCAPKRGEASAAERLRAAGLVQRDMTRTVKPYLYVLTKEGDELLGCLVNVLKSYGRQPVRRARRCTTRA